MSSNDGREREAVALLLIVLLGVVATGLWHGVNFGLRGRPVAHCQWTLADGFACRPLKALGLDIRTSEGKP